MTSHILFQFSSVGWWHVVRLMLFVIFSPSCCGVWVLWVCIQGSLFSWGEIACVRVLWRVV